MEALGISLPGLLAQLVNFGLLYFILSRLAFPAILKMLDERSARIKEGLEAADRARAEAAAAQTNVQAQLQEALREGQAIIDQASKAAQQVREEIIADAQKQSEQMLARARAEFALERDKALQDLRAQFADITIVAAEKVINESLDKNKHQRLIQDVLEQSRLN